MPGIALDYVSVEAWAHLPWLRAAFSTRSSGTTAVYRTDAESLGGQNLGRTREDDPIRVSENRRQFLGKITGDPACPLITLKQIHSAIVREVTSRGTNGTGAVSPSLHAYASHSPATMAAIADGTPPEGDGLISGVPGLLLGILTADCVPVLVADTRTRVVAAFHAGWRGTLARIVETGIATLREAHASRPEDLVATIGPAIRPCCFEVGPEVQAEFASAFDYADSLLLRLESDTAVTRPRLDLQEANRRQLLDAGLAVNQIQTVAECTACCQTVDGRRKYFSYRADAGVTGRMMSVIGALETRQS